jgi:hypothetical protein
MLRDINYNVLFYYHSYKCLLCNVIIPLGKRFYILQIRILLCTLVSITGGLTLTMIPMGADSVTTPEESRVAERIQQCRENPEAVRESRGAERIQRGRKNPAARRESRDAERIQRCRENSGA